MSANQSSNCLSPRRARFSAEIILRLLLFGVVLLPNRATANHIIGGEMTYRYLSDVDSVTKRFEFTLTVFRDCDAGGAQLDNPGRVAIYRGSLMGGVMVESFGIPSSSIIEVPPVIPACADNSQLPQACVERGLYVFSRDIKVLPDESYFIVYQRCCRTSAIVNITNPLNYGATYMVELPPAAVMGNNSSPTFTNYPPGFICNHLPLDFDHSATDVDGDSLVYSFCNPLNGGGRNGQGCDSPQPNPPCGPPFEDIIFSPAYSASNPMGGSPAIVIDAESGLLHGSPNKNGQFVVGICVSEYRNGQLIGTVLRDFQFNVVDCVPSVVALVKADSLFAQDTFLVRSCGSKTVTFFNLSPQNTATLTYSWAFDLGGGNIFYSDDWHATVTFPDWGTYHGILYLNTGFECADTAYVVARTFPPMTADFVFDYDSCALTPVEFRDRSTAEAPGGLTSWTWTFGPPGASSALQNPDYQYAANGNYTVKLKATDANKCFKEVTKIVPYVPKPPVVIPAAGPWEVCLPDSARFDLFSPAAAASANFLWRFGDGTTSSAANPRHRYAQASTYTASVFTKNEYGCSSADTFENAIHIYPEIAADFVFAFDSCAITPVVFRDKTKFGAIGGLSVWEWSFGLPSAVDSIQNPEYQYDMPGFYPVRLRVTDANGCQSDTAKVLEWQPLPLPEIPFLSPMFICLPDSAAFELFDAAAAASADFTWDFGDGQRSHEPNPTHFYAQGGTFSPNILLQNIYGCTAVDTFLHRIRVSSTPRAGFSYAPSQPSNLENRVHFTDESSTEAVFWTWDFGNGKGSHEQHPIFEFQDTGLVRVMLTAVNADGCADSIEQTLDIAPRVRLYIPNAIAPDATDGHGNEVFKVAGVLPGYSDFRLRVWSRWGELLFETTDIEEGWNGRRMGASKRMPPGVYLYEMRLTGPRGEPLHWEGTVTTF